LGLIKVLLQKLKHYPESILSIKIIDDPSYTFNKQFLIIEKNKKNVFNDINRGINLFINCKIELQFELNNSYFNYMSINYPTAISLFKNCRPNEIDFEHVYKITGLYYNIRKYWRFSDINTDEIALNNLSIISEAVFNEYIGEYNKLIQKLNSNTELINKFTKFYKPYWFRFYELPFYYIGSENLKQVFIKSSMDALNLKHLNNLMELHKEFDESMVKII